MTSEPLSPSGAAPGPATAPGQAETVATVSSGFDLVESIVAASVVAGRMEQSSAPSQPSDPVERMAATPASLRVEQISTVAPASSGGLTALVGVCVDDRHPSLAGRVLVRIVDGEGERERWLATLAHLPVRCEDRVLLLQPGNWPEPLIVGVIDGLRPRTAPTRAAAALTLRSDETLEVRDSDGTPLLAITPTPAGPVLRLARADQRLEIAGRLAFAADAIDFVARGEMSLAAGGDVVVTGEEIKLN
jgi:hypothetical protein